MANLTAPRSTVKLNSDKRKVVPVAAGALILQGALALTKDGFASPAAADNTLVAVGRVESGADNRSGAAGAVSIEVERGIFAWDNDAAAPVTQALVGKACFVLDDHTVSASGAPVTGVDSRAKAGIVYQVDDAGVWVETR